MPSDDLQLAHPMSISIPVLRELARFASPAQLVIDMASLARKPENSPSGHLK
jgi:prephenate dehydrogenase